MWDANAPAYTVEQAALACITGIRNKALGRRLQTAIPTLKTHGTRYRRAAATATIHTLAPATFAVPGLTHAEMVWLYDRRIATHGRPGRVIYLALLRGAVLDRCPYSNYGRPKTLDHVAGKEHFDSLAINPWNLVPCCWDCNTTKGSALATTSHQEPLHPYFLPPINRWLHAEILPGSPAVAEYFAQPDIETPPGVAARILSHFEQFRLAEMYASVSGGTITENTSQSRRLFNAGGAAAVRAHLLEMAGDTATDTNPNNWRAVLYEALAASDWYCQGGFDE